MGSFVGTSANGGNVTALTTANSAAITWPTVQAGDLAILAWTMQNTATPTDPTSQAFTLVGTLDDGSCRSRVLKRICNGTESGTITGWSNSIQNRQTAVLFVVRGYSDIAGITSAAEPGTTTAHDCPAIGTGNGAATGDTIIVIGTDRSGATTTATPPAGFAKRTTSEFGLAAAGGTYTGVADDGLVTAQTMPFDPAAWTMASGSAAVTWTLALRPATLIAGTDSTALTEGSTALQRQSSTSDSHTLTEGTTALQRQSASSDTAALTDASSLTGLLPALDSAALAESSSVQIVTALNGTDAAALTEATADLQRTSDTTDAVSVAESAALAISSSSADTSALTDSAMLARSSSATDSAALSESASVTELATKTATDAALLGELAALEQQFALSDAIVGTDQAAVASDGTSVDTAGLSEGALIAVSLSAADTASITEGSSVLVIPRTTTRPDLGKTTRTNSGITPRPDLGVTERP